MQSLPVSRLLSVFFLFAFGLPLFAQQSDGWALDPHAGISSGFLQPAATVASPYDWDINLASFSVGASTSYGYIRNASALSLYSDSRGASEFSASETEFTFQIGSATYAYDFDRDDTPISTFANVDVLGPAFSVQLGRMTRVGVFTRLRVSTGFTDVDSELNYYPYDAIPNNVDYTVNTNLAATGASWGEVGLNLSRAFEVGYDAELRVGISPRYLLPLSGFSAQNPEGIRIRQFSGDSLMITAADTRLSISDDLLTVDPSTSPNGRGFGLDLGVQYAWGEADDYGFRYTFGVSLLDLGQLTFDRNARNYDFTNAGSVILMESDYSLNSPDSLGFQLSQLTERVNGVASDGTAANFSVALPTTLSLQFAYQPVTGAQLAVAYRGGLPFAAESQLVRPQSLTLAAHYSRWWVGGGLTAGVYDWSEVNLGLQLRVGPVYFGTDQLFGTALRANTFSSASFYAGIRVHDFARGRKRSNRGGRSGRKRGKSNTGCYQF